MRPLGVVAAVALTIALKGTVASVDMSVEVLEKLRELAETAGCAKDNVRVALRWAGQGKPLEVEVWCVKEGGKP